MPAKTGLCSKRRSYFWLRDFASSREAGAHFADLDGRPFDRWTFIRDRDGLFLGLAVEEKEPADHLLGFREWSVDDAALAVADLHANAMSVRCKRVAAQMQTAPLQVGGEFQHRVIGRASHILGPVPPVF